MIDPSEIDSLHAMLQANQPRKKKQSGNFLTHLIPTIGGTGGAIGGAAAGTAIAPGVGTILGALLGGALAGGASKVGENALEHQKLNSGVAGQAIEQGILGAGPIRLAKLGTVGAKAGFDAARGGADLAGALTSAGERANTPILKNVSKNLVTQGQQAQSRVGGFSAGQKIANRELTPQDSQKMLETLKSENINIGNANNTYRDLQNKLNAYGKQISTHFTTNNSTLTKPQVNKIARDYVKSLNTTDPSVLKQANVLANDLKKNVSDTQTLWKFRRSLDGRIPDSKFMDAATSDKITALKGLRQNITDKLGSVPGASNYHALSEIKPFVSAEAKRLNNPGGGIVGRIAASGPVQKAESLIGKGTEKAGSVLGGADNLATRGLTPGAIASRTVPIGAAQALSATGQQMQSTDTQQPDLTSALLSAQGAGQGGSDSQPQSDSPYSQENLIADIQRDPKHASDYISTFKELDAIFNPQGKSNKLNSTQVQQANNATSGIQSLDEIAQTLQQNPNATKLSKLPGGSLTSSLTGTGAYKAAVNNAADVIGRLRSGGAINSDEEKRFMSLLPGAFDDPKTVNYKLQSLYSLFNSFANPQSAQPDSTDLTSALINSGYGQ